MYLNDREIHTLISKTRRGHRGTDELENGDLTMLITQIQVFLLKHVRASKAF